MGDTGLSGLALLEEEWAAFESRPRFWAMLLMVRNFARSGRAAQVQRMLPTAETDSQRLTQHSRTSFSILRAATKRIATQWIANTFPTMITVEATEKEFHVTIPRGAVDERAFATFIEWLRDESVSRRRETSHSLEEIAASSHMTEAQADALADEIEGKWWAENRHRFLPPR